MSTKKDLEKWIVEALEAKGGESNLLEVCKFVWAHHEDDLKNSGNLFYTWQYDIRWAATNLRRAGKLLPEKESRRGIWQLS
jgi:hypothetical protein